MLLTKGQMLKVEGRKHKDIDVPELGGQVRVTNISAGCGITLKEIADKGGSQRDMALAMFTSCVVDEKDDPMFDEAEALAFIAKISSETLSLIVSEITALSRSAKSAANGAEVPAGNPSSATQLAPSPSA